MKCTRALVCSFGFRDPRVEDMLAAWCRNVDILTTTCAADDLSALTAADHSIALFVVTPDGLAAACRALADLRSALPLTAPLIVALNVPASGMEQLMAHGAFDFVADLRRPEELLVRIRRALGAIDSAQPLGCDPSVGGKSVV